MDNVLHLFNEIRQNPLLYIGEGGLDALKLFVDGYQHRQSEISPDYFSDFFHFDAFLGSEYICGTLGWPASFLKESNGQKESFALFYRKLDEFILVLSEIESRPQVAWTAPFDEGSYMRYCCIQREMKKYTAKKEGAPLSKTLNVFPTDPNKTVAFDIESVQRATDVLAYLKNPIGSYGLAYSHADKPTFINSGTALKNICCPSCQTPLSFEWWGRAMNASSASGFKNLTVTTPCCNSETSLNDLNYDMPCGFASFWLQLKEPTAEPTQSVLEQIEQIFGCPVRVVTTYF